MLLNSKPKYIDGQKVLSLKDINGDEATPVVLAKLNAQGEFELLESLGSSGGSVSLNNIKHKDYTRGTTSISPTTYSYGQLYQSLRVANDDINGNELKVKVNGIVVADLLQGEVLDEIFDDFSQVEISSTTGGVPFRLWIRGV